MSSKEYHKKASARHYQAHKEEYIARARKRDKVVWDWYYSMKNGPCADCGITYPAWIMEFDHLPQYTKVANVSVLIRKGYSIPKIQQEIDKCDLVCANCHRNRTHHRLLGSDPNGQEALC